MLWSNLNLLTSKYDKSVCDYGFVPVVADGEDPCCPGKAGISEDCCCHACKSCRQTSSCAIHQVRIWVGPRTAPFWLVNTFRRAGTSTSSALMSYSRNIGLKMLIVARTFFSRCLFVFFSNSGSNFSWCFLSHTKKTRPSWGAVSIIGSAVLQFFVLKVWQLQSSNWISCNDVPKLCVCKSVYGAIMEGCDGTWNSRWWSHCNWFY